MKSGRVKKTTLIIQCVCCLIWLILLLDVPSLINMLPEGGVKNVLAVIFTVIFAASLILPVGPVCLTVDIIALCREKKRARHKRRIGSRCVLLVVFFGLVSGLWWMTISEIIVRAGV